MLCADFVIATPSATAEPQWETTVKLLSRDERTKLRNSKRIAEPVAATSAVPTTQPNQTPATPTPKPTGSSNFKLPETVLTREQILNSDPARLARVGRHVMIGFRDLNEAVALVEKQAITGVFITDDNAKGRTVEAIRADIDRLQAIRKQQGLPPLIVAADQEGGAVSRLSPPLQKQSSLAEVIANLQTDAERKPAVEAYAKLQAEELARVGVTLNFAPVVDLNLNPTNTGDGQTLLRFRSIAADPYTVAKVAGWYCETMRTTGIMCTIKHFPGIGRVMNDTHVSTGEITASEGQLELNDWVPFRRLMDKPHIVTMIGHVRVKSIDPDTPASYSKTVIGGLMRKTWKHDGIVITDDWSMGAITKSPDKLGGAAVKALQAGADIVLVSWIEKHLDATMTGLLAAEEQGVFDADMRAKSLARLSRASLSAPQAPAQSQ